MLKTHLSNLEKALDNERENRECLMDQKLKERKALETKITNLLEEHAKARKIREAKLVKAIEDKSDEIHQELLKERNIRNQNLGKFRCLSHVRLLCCSRVSKCDQFHVYFCCFGCATPI